MKQKSISDFLNLAGISCFSLLLITACEKTEGPGGTGSISGTLIRQSFNDDYSLLIDEQPAVDEEIFILYGDQEVLGDRKFTSYPGRFSFDYLRPGNYTLYYMSEDSATISDEKIEVIIKVDLKNGENKDLGDLVQFKTLDFDNGTAIIKGVVKVTNYTNESQWPNLVIKDISCAQEQEIYLIYGNHTFYDERIRTQYNGYFEFNHLIPGDYTIFLYSEDLTGGTEMVTITRTITIAGMDQVGDLGEIMIYKH